MTLLTVRKIFTALCKSTRCFPYLTNIRKFNYEKLHFFLTAQVVPGILVILIGYLGCDIILVLIIWFIAVTLITAGYAGAMANIVDIAPNFAGGCLCFDAYSKISKIYSENIHINRRVSLQGRYWRSHRQFT